MQAAELLLQHGAVVGMYNYDVGCDIQISSCLVIEENVGKIASRVLEQQQSRHQRDVQRMKAELETERKGDAGRRRRYASLRQAELDTLVCAEGMAGLMS